MATNFTYHLPTRMKVGPKSLATLESELKVLGRNLLIVTDPVVTRALQLPDRLIGPLQGSGLKFSVFDEIEPNPSIETVSHGADFARHHQMDCLIAVGGGSVLDCAKGIAIVSRYGGNIWDYIGDSKVPGPVPPIVAIPTTSGTGSEVTPFAVFTNKERARKDGLFSPFVFPALSIIDPEILTSMPPNLTADTGLDALAHAVEAYTGRSAHPFVEASSEQAFALIARFLIRAVEYGHDLEARRGMAMASALAGISITHGGVGAAHGFGMSIGGLYGAPHGRTIGILLPAIMKYNLPAHPEKFSLIAELFRRNDADGLFASAQDAAEMVSRILQKTGVPASLKSLGLTKADALPITIDCIGRSDMRNNARGFNREEAVSFLEAVIGD
ncbi:MAG: iron-containing alcohol dehydrogenase [Terriglobia bacterium]